MNFLHQLAHSLRQAAGQRLRSWTRPENHGPVLNAALDLTRCKSELLMENALLRQQLIVLERQITRPQRAKLAQRAKLIQRAKLSQRAASLRGRALSRCRSPHFLPPNASFCSWQSKYARRIILDHIPRQEQPPLGNVDQARPSVTFLWLLESGRGPVELLFAEADAGLHEPSNRTNAQVSSTDSSSRLGCIETGTRVSY